MITKSSWLEVTDSSSRLSRVCWCVLENGVLWFYQKPGSNEGKDCLPLHDAVVGDCDPATHLQLAVRCRRSGRVVALKASSKDDYTAWLTILSQVAREWSDKRRASILNKQLMAIILNKDRSDSNENTQQELSEEIMKFAPRRKSEVITHDVSSDVYEHKNLHEQQLRRKTLKEIVEAIEDLTQLRWANLTEVKRSGLLGLLTEEQIALEELKFAALIEEFRFHQELKVLIRLATRAVSWQDPCVPPYHKRAIVNSLHKVRNSSAVVLRMAERHWCQKVTLQNAIFTLLGHEARVAAWQQTYTEYCSHLSELRSIFNRSWIYKPEMEHLTYSKKYDLELALVPLQHLTSQRQMIQTIFELLPPGSPEIVNFDNQKILDSCYHELTELDGSEYVADMDNALHFDLSKINPIAPGPKLLPRQPQIIRPPTAQYDDIYENNNQEAVLRKMSKAKSRPSAIFGALTNAVRRLTAEGNDLAANRRSSMPDFMIAQQQDLTEEIQPEPEKIEPPPIKRKIIVDEYEPGKVVPRFFIGEPLYQDYLLAIAEVSEEEEDLE